MSLPIHHTQHLRATASDLRATASGLLAMALLSELNREHCAPGPDRTAPHSPARHSPRAPGCQQMPTMCAIGRSKRCQKPEMKGGSFYLGDTRKPERYFSLASQPLAGLGDLPQTVEMQAPQPVIAGPPGSSAGSRHWSPWLMADPRWDDGSQLSKDTVLHLSGRSSYMVSSLYIVCLVLGTRGACIKASLQLAHASYNIYGLLVDSSAGP